MTKPEGMSDDEWLRLKFSELGEALQETIGKAMVEAGEALLEGTKKNWNDHVAKAKAMAEEKEKEGSE